MDIIKDMIFFFFGGGYASFRIKMILTLKYK